MKTKRLAALLLVFAALCAGWTACAENAGFGVVNADAVNVRTEPQGNLLFRAEKGQNVFVSESAVDSSGQLWYRIVIYERPVQTGSRREAWMMAKFVDMLDEASRDIVQVALNNDGYIALHADGTVSGAEMGKYDSEETSVWLSGLRDIRAVETSLYSYFAIDQDNRLYQRGIRCLYLADEQLAESLPARLLASDLSDGLIAVTDDALLFSGGFPAIEQYVFFPDGALPAVNDIVQLAASSGIFAALDADGQMHAAVYASFGEAALPFSLDDWQHLARIDLCLAKPQIGWANERVIGVRRDGTAVAYPETLQAQVAGWTDLADAKLGRTFVIGLKTDGSVVCAGDERIAQSVSSWRNVASIDAANGYCAAVTQDGQLLFAGELPD